MEHRSVVGPDGSGAFGPDMGHEQCHHRRFDAASAATPGDWEQAGFGVEDHVCGVVSPPPPLVRTLVLIRIQPLDRQIHHFGVFKAPDAAGVETIVRSHAADHPVVPGGDVHRGRDRDPGRVSALSRVLAAHPRSGSDVPPRIRAAHYHGRE